MKLTGHMMGKCRIVSIVIFIVLIMLFGGLYIKLDNSTCKVSVVIEFLETSEYNPIDFKLILKSQSGKYKEYYSSFKRQSGKCSITVPRGIYSVGVVYDEELYVCDIIDISELKTYTYVYAEDNLPLLRAIECSFFFWDDKSSLTFSHSSESLPSVIDENGEELKQYEIKLRLYNEYVILVDDKCQSLNWTVSANGYEPVIINYDDDMFRVQELEVDLHEKQ